MRAPWWWRYALPNAVTCISLIAGLASISSSLHGAHREAAWFILLSVVLDKLDGTVARLVRGTSDFGIQMDSLTDLICFGVAPAVLVLAVLVGSHPVTTVQWRPGWAVAAYVGAFFYVIVAALRLAKFNVVTGVYGDRYFFGITTTLAGAIVSSGFLVLLRYPAVTEYVQVLPVVMLVLGGLMVSNVPLPKPRPGASVVAKTWFWGNVGGVYLCAFGRFAPEYLLVVAIGYFTIGSVRAWVQGVRAPQLGPPSRHAVRDERGLSGGPVSRLGNPEANDT